MHIPQLREVDDEQMAILTHQESHTVKGQAEKMALVGSCIRSRYEAARYAAERQLGDTSDMERHEVEARIDQIVQPLEFQRIDLGDGRFNLIVSKGEDEYLPGHEDGNGLVRKRPLYSVCVPAHVDTVPGTHTSLTRQGDRWEGLGVYDMGAAVLNGIALAVDVRVPKGMKVHFVFTADEEMHSLGARLLMKGWERWPEIDCIISSEIGPVPPLKSGDKHMRIIGARAGRQKFVGNITISPQFQGHGSQEKMPNASDALIELLSKVQDRFYRGYKDPLDIGSPFEPPLQRTDALLGTEMFETGEIRTHKRPGYFPPHAADFDFAIRTVPPSRLAEMEAVLQRIVKGIAKRGDWSKFGIDYSLRQNPGVSSYAPYAMPPNHRLLMLSTDVLSRITGVLTHVVGARSVADECDYAADMLLRAGVHSFADTHKGIVNIPINGDLAHHPGEWVSRMDTARVRFAIKMLLEDQMGLQTLMRRGDEQT